MIIISISKRFIGCILLLINLIIMPIAIASIDTTAGRYLTVQNKPLPEQKNLMLQTIQVNFPPNVKTVGDAIRYILKPSGYTLTPLDKASLEVKKLFAFNLPIVDRNFGPMTLQDALKTLVGDSFTMSVDHVNRQISFHLYQSDDD